MNSNKEILGLHRITKVHLKQLCRKHRLYQTPHLNDQLYLHYQGFQAIENLEEYTGLKCLWLECNAISEIQGLECLKELKCLFLQNNLIRKIENLESCSELDTLNLASNHISKIENCGVEVLPVLSTLNLSRNYIRCSEGLKELVNCKSLWSLDLSHNRIDDILVVKIFASMPELRVLILQGNPVVNRVPQYRKTLILECKNLTYLDSRPVFPKDRACAEAWKRGGYEEERREHERWIRAERRKIRESVNATLRLRIKAGDKQITLITSTDEESDEERDRRGKSVSSSASDVEATGDQENSGSSKEGTASLSELPDTAELRGHKVEVVAVVKEKEEKAAEEEGQVVSEEAGDVQMKDLSAVTQEPAAEQQKDVEVATEQQMGMAAAPEQQMDVEAAAEQEKEVRAAAEQQKDVEAVDKQQNNVPVVIEEPAAEQQKEVPVPCEVSVNEPKKDEESRPQMEQPIVCEEPLQAENNLEPFVVMKSDSVVSNRPTANINFGSSSSSSELSSDSDSFLLDTSSSADESNDDVDEIQFEPKEQPVVCDVAMQSSPQEEADNLNQTIESRPQEAEEAKEDVEMLEPSPQEAEEAKDDVEKLEPDYSNSMSFDELAESQSTSYTETMNERRIMQKVTKLPARETTNSTDEDDSGLSNLFQTPSSTEVDNRDDVTPTCETPSALVETPSETPPPDDTELVPEGPAINPEDINMPDDFEARTWLKTFLAGLKVEQDRVLSDSSSLTESSLEEFSDSDLSFPTRDVPDKPEKSDGGQEDEDSGGRTGRQNRFDKIMEDMFCGEENLGDGWREKDLAASNQPEKEEADLERTLTNDDNERGSQEPDLLDTIFSEAAALQDTVAEAEHTVDDATLQEEKENNIESEESVSIGEYEIMTAEDLAWWDRTLAAARSLTSSATPQALVELPEKDKNFEERPRAPAVSPEVSEESKEVSVTSPEATEESPETHDLPQHDKAEATDLDSTLTETQSKIDETTTMQDLVDDTDHLDNMVEKENEAGSQEQVPIREQELTSAEDMSWLDRILAAANSSTSPAPNQELNELPIKDEDSEEGPKATEECTEVTEESLEASEDSPDASQEYLEATEGPPEATQEYPKVTEEIPEFIEESLELMEVSPEGTPKSPEATEAFPKITELPPQDKAEAVDLLDTTELPPQDKAETVDLLDTIVSETQLQIDEPTTTPDPDDATDLLDSMLEAQQKEHDATLQEEKETKTGSQESVPILESGTTSSEDMPITTSVPPQEPEEFLTKDENFEESPEATENPQATEESPDATEESLETEVLSAQDKAEVPDLISSVTQSQIDETTTTPDLVEATELLDNIPESEQKVDGATHPQQENENEMVKQEPVPSMEGETTFSEERSWWQRTLAASSSITSSAPVQEPGKFPIKDDDFEETPEATKESPEATEESPKIQDLPPHHKAEAADQLDNILTETHHKADEAIISQGQDESTDLDNMPEAQQEVEGATLQEEKEPQEAQEPVSLKDEQSTSPENMSWWERTLAAAKSSTSPAPVQEPDEFPPEDEDFEESTESPEEFPETTEESPQTTEDRAEALDLLDSILGEKQHQTDGTTTKPDAAANAPSTILSETQQKNDDDTTGTQQESPPTTAEDESSDDDSYVELPPPADIARMATLREVLDSFNQVVEIMNKRRKEREQLINEFVNDPLTKAEATETPEQLEQQIKKIKEEKHERVRQLVDHVYAQRDKYNDTLEVVDGRLMVVKRDTGALEEVPPPPALIFGRSMGDGTQAQTKHVSCGVSTSCVVEEPPSAPPQQVPEEPSISSYAVSSVNESDSDEYATPLSDVEAEQPPPQMDDEEDSPAAWTGVCEEDEVSYEKAFSEEQAKSLQKVHEFHEQIDAEIFSEVSKWMVEGSDIPTVSPPVKKPLEREEIVLLKQMMVQEAAKEAAKEAQDEDGVLEDIARMFESSNEDEEEFDAPE